MADILKQTLRWANDPDNRVEGTAGGSVDIPMETAMSQDGSDATYAAVSVPGIVVADGNVTYECDGPLELCTADAISFLRFKFRALTQTDGDSDIGSAVAWAIMGGNLMEAGATVVPDVFTDLSFDVTSADLGTEISNALINGAAIGLRYNIITDDESEGFIATRELRWSEFSVEVWGPDSSGNGPEGGIGIGAGSGAFGGVAVYPNLSLGGVAGPVTLAAAGAAVLTAGVPCRGARAVTFRCVATNSAAPSAMAAKVGNSPLRAETFTLADASLGFSVRGTAAVRCDQTGGNTFTATCIDPRGTIPWDFMQFSVTPGAGATNGFAVQAEVAYDIDAGIALAAYGQSGLSVSTA